VKGLRALVLALWSGALLTIGGLVAPTLFRVLPDRALAGFIAGELFHRATWLSVVAGAIAFGLRSEAGADVRPRFPSHRAWPLLPAALLLANEYALRPVMDSARAAGRVTPAFMAWHGLSAALYAAATLLALALLIRELRR
jgi:hypothetical protein